MRMRCQLQKPIPSFTVEAGDGVIAAGVNGPGTNSGSGESGVGVVGPVRTSGGIRAACRDRPATYGEFPEFIPEGNPGSVGAGEQVESSAGGVVERGWVRECPGREDSFYWVTQVDAIDLVPSAAARVAALLPAPSPDVNPSAEAGGIVNLGLWLAIEDPGVITARAALGGVWAQVDARVSGLRVDLGNGDVVECDGVGVPIGETGPEWESLEQGPCGYTYRVSSPDEDPYVMSMTAVFEVSWRTSDGRLGSLDELSRSWSFDYDVDEIQTVGVAN